MYMYMNLYRYRMDAQHAGQLGHATRQTDATCYMTAEFRYMVQVYGRCYTAPPSQGVCPHTSNSNILRNAVKDNHKLEVVFFGLIFSMVGLGWELLLVAWHAGSLVVDHWVLPRSFPPNSSAGAGALSVLGSSMSG